MLLLWPTVSAAAPAAVEGITASNVSGNAKVEWESVEEAVFYRLYHSNRSILENSGVYDDFIETNGALTEYYLDGSMLSDRVFVAVLAVDENGEESPVFLKEASVVLKGNAVTEENVSLEEAEPREESASSSSSEESETLTVATPAEQQPTEQASSVAEEQPAVPEWQAPVSDGKLHLLLAEATKPTEVLLQFNVFPMVEPDAAPTAFSIVNGDGVPLRILSIYIQEEFIAMQTETQTIGELYQIMLSEPLMSTTGGPLDEVNRKAVFIGHPEGTTVRAAASSSVATTFETFEPTIPEKQCNPEDVARVFPVSGLRLRSTEQDDGNHTLSVSWSYDTKNCADQLRYVVRQSRDRGRTFSNAQIIPAAISGIEIPNATPGEYGIGIAVLNAQGRVSQEIFQSIILPGAVPAPVVAQPTPQLPKPAAPPPTPRPVVTALPQTGAGLFTLGGSSLSMAWYLRRRKN